MIKEKYLVPGRVLGRLTSRERITMNEATDIGHRWFEDYWRPFMVVAYYPDIKRRHSRSTAPVSGWEVLIIWLGETTRPVEHVRIPCDHDGWKLLW